MKSTLTGLCKLSGDECPTEITLELIAIDAFEKADKNGDNKITLQEFLDYCAEDPECKSWIEYYDDPSEGEPDPMDIVLPDSDMEIEGAVTDRPGEPTAAVNDDAVFKLDIEAGSDEF